jgi:hypothetical protein
LALSVQGLPDFIRVVQSGETTETGLDGAIVRGGQNTQQLVKVAFVAYFDVCFNQGIEEVAGYDEEVYATEVSLAARTSRWRMGIACADDQAVV